MVCCCHLAMHVAHLLNLTRRCGSVLFALEIAYLVFRLLFTSSQKWPMDDKADPLTGWSVWDVHRVSSVASQDAYGKLFKHLWGVMLSFLKHINIGKADFEMYCLDIKGLSAHLPSNAYNRIEVRHALTVALISGDWCSSRRQPMYLTQGIWASEQPFKPWLLYFNRVTTIHTRLS